MLVAVGYVQQSVDGMEEGDIFSEQNPGITLTGECKVVIELDEVKSESEKSEL